MSTEMSLSHERPRAKRNSEFQLEKCALYVHAGRGRLSLYMDYTGVKSGLSNLFPK